MAPQPASVRHTVAASRGKPALKTEASTEGSPSQVAHTLTACTRCRQRKTRCDPGLPKCGPCDRTSSVCEYYDSSKGHNVNRNYVVYLQHKVRELEEELERLESEDSAEDPEAMMRAADVRMYDAKESKFLGPSSGIAITRLVMQLAKQFTDSKSIKDIVPEQRARQIKEIYQQEQAKPTSKIYPLISDVAANELPNRNLTDLLIQLYKLKVQPMYPALHEPTLDKDIDAVYERGEEASPYQNFVCRMVLAISLQKMDTQYAGLADSYYLAALTYMEPVVQPMDMRTLQCFALMAEYSLLTPTRTAIYYIVGIAVRLAQALGYNEEKTVTRTRADGKPNFLEMDMRRRLFWCIFVMDCGLAHSLGRPAILATNHEHIDVAWFESCDDKYITPDGVDPTAPRPTLKKWIAIHFFKMRLLQLEIRRKLYQRKRSEPKDDNDSWFHEMDAKLCAWRDAAPNFDEGIGLDKVWFIGRYNTMIVFMYRPSPQVPRPMASSALKCYDACAYNIYMQRGQIKNRNVDLTWVFTQSIFMAINTMLWSLSYVEVRKTHSKADVVQYLDVAMEAIQLASERWPGVASAVQLYQNLIEAILKIYEKDCDVPIAATTPSDFNSPTAYQDALNRSRTTSPATASSNTSVSTPPMDKVPHAQFHQRARRSVEPPPPMPYQSDPPNLRPAAASPLTTPPSQTMPIPPSLRNESSLESEASQLPVQQFQQPTNFSMSSYNNPLPDYSPELGVWSTAPQPPMVAYATQTSMPTYDAYANPVFDPNSEVYPFPAATNDPPLDPTFMSQYMDFENNGAFGEGLNLDQQQELMQSLETSGMEDIQSMITSTLSAITPKPQQTPH